ncbi:MAG: hypothetical protein IPO63_15580 [Bacteroidetes bacterium]|nr:hypothetical protein [Bacteroidota bacterium]
MKKVLQFFSLLFGFPICLVGQVSLPLLPSGTVEVTEFCQNGIPLTFISNGILATGTAANNVVNVLNECRMTYRAKDMIHLRPGFHAGQFNNSGYKGYFKTEFFNHEVKLVSPNASSIVNGVVNVPKWEKLEIAFRLPPAFEDAIDNFFEHYYDAATGNQVNPLTDLNPYASDSLEVRVTFTSPTGRIVHRDGFFMREAIWGAAPSGGGGAPVPGAAELAENVDQTNDLVTNNWRVRFAPDEVDLTIPWIMKIEVSTNINFISPQSIDMGNFAFLCVDPLPDNHGYLHVNANNNRYLQFDDGTDYLGMGINLGEGRKIYSDEEMLRSKWFKMQKLDFDYMNEIIGDLTLNGGNEIRISMNRSSFAFEWENLGVYDAYTTNQLCNYIPDPNSTVGWTGPYPNVGNRQNHAWALDKLLENCRDNDVYVQLNLFLAVNYHAFQTFLWGDNAYYKTFVVDNPAPNSLQGWDTKKFFISQANFSPASGVADVGSIYYWKRHFKYLMARWGYSTNIAWFETFNEIDAILRFRNEDLTVVDDKHLDMCSENQINFPQENSTREYIKIWHQYLINYIKTDLDNDGRSPCKPNHLWSVSYAAADLDILHSDPTYYELYDLPVIDIVDLHSYDFPMAQSSPQIN